MFGEAGEAVEEAPIRQIMEAPSHPYTKSLWAVRSLETPAKPELDRLLEVNGVSASYGTFKVLEDIDFSVGKRQTLAVVGESGSGKSTLARVITGLLPPSDGRITFDEAATAQAFRDLFRDFMDGASE